MAKACGWSELYNKPWLDLASEASLAWLAEEIKNRRRPDEVMIAIHILQIRDTYDIDAIASTSLVAQLIDWSDADGLWVNPKLTEKRLSEMLMDAYGIGPRRIRVNGVQCRGYILSEFERLRVLCHTSDDDEEPSLKLIRGGRSTKEDG